MVPEHELLTLAEQITALNVIGTKTILDSMIEGKEPLVILGEIIRFFKTMLIALCSPESGHLTAMFEENWSNIIKVASSWNEISIQETIKHLTSRYSLVKNSELPHLFLEVSVMEIIKLAPNSATRTVSSSVQQQDLVSQQPWKTWTSPDNAILWAQGLLPHLSLEDLRTKWNETPSVNGKKAAEWVKKVEQMRIQSSVVPVKLTTV